MGRLADVIPLSIPSPPSDWSVFEVGTWIHSWLPIWPAEWSLVIYVYALAIMTGIVVAVLVSNRRLTARGGEPWVVIDLALWAVVFGIVGARAWHVVTHPDDFFGPGKDLLKTLYVWEGGVAIFGAILGGALGVWIASRIAGLRFGAVADAIAPSLLLAQAIGRIGNYFNQELFGLPTDLPWGLEIDRPNAAIPAGIPEDALFHPTFLYEILWNIAGFVVLILIENRVQVIRKLPGSGGILPFSVEFHRRDAWHWGKMVGLWAIWYGIGRTWLESIRLDPLDTFLGVRYNVWGALAAIVLGIVIIAVQSRRHPGVEPSVYRPGRSAPAAVDSEDVFPDEPEDATGDSPRDGAPATSGTARR